MKDRPIIFDAESIRSILEGHKTQARRVIKPQPLGYDPLLNAGGVWEFCDDRDPNPLHFYRCPYGVAGDRLWVRETWRVRNVSENGRVAIDYKATPEIIHTPWCYPSYEIFKRLEQQTWEDAESKGIHGWDAGESPARWRSPIYMPRWASRIVFVIVSIRVERLRNISEADAVSEGIETSHAFDGSIKYVSYSEPGISYLESDPRTAFLFRWDTINAKRGFCWENNPWVWVVEFSKVAL